MGKGRLGISWFEDKALSGRPVRTQLELVFAEFYSETDYMERFNESMRSFLAGNLKIKRSQELSIML